MIHLVEQGHSSNEENYKVVFYTFAAMKRHRVFIGWFLLLALASCHRPLETQGIASLPPDISPELLYIDSLMWYHPDSALTHLIYYFKPDSATLTISTRSEYNRRYAHLLLSELLFKNNYPQTNRESLLRSMGYFDSIAQVPEPVEGPSNESNAFLSARTHYMNGVGFQEHDSVIEACTEYIRALEIMENHFPIVETHHGTSLQNIHIPRFMMLIYWRIGQNAG